MGSNILHRLRCLEKKKPSKGNRWSFFSCLVLPVTLVWVKAKGLRVSFSLGGFSPASCGFVLRAMETSGITAPTSRAATTTNAPHLGTDTSRSRSSTARPRSSRHPYLPLCSMFSNIDTAQIQPKNTFPAVDLADHTAPICPRPYTSARKVPASTVVAGGHSK